jgi:hypothetical protein
VPAEAGFSVSVPLVAIVPLQLPDAWQLRALLDDHVIVVDVPAEIDVVARLSVGVAGAEVPVGVTVRVAVLFGEAPLVLEQVSVYVYVPLAVGVSV